MAAALRALLRRQRHLRPPRRLRGGRRLRAHAADGGLRLRPAPGARRTDRPRRMPAARHVVAQIRRSPPHGDFLRLDRGAHALSAPRPPPAPWPPLLSPWVGPPRRTYAIGRACRGRGERPPPTLAPTPP